MQKVHTYNVQMTHNLSIKISKNTFFISTRNLLFCHLIFTACAPQVRNFHGNTILKLNSSIYKIFTSL